MRACTVAAIQLSAGPDPALNLPRAVRLTADALSAGADLVALPESYSAIGPAGQPAPASFDPQRPEASELVAPLCELSRDSAAVLVLGGVPERIPGEERTYNTCLVVHAGRVVARYRKIHCFDATLADGTELRESAHVRPGERGLVVDTSVGRVGLSVCYDLRFPELYRALVAHGAELLLVPSAFTHETGAAHWEVLLRARAIECQAFVVAPAQDGVHAAGRRSWGRSMVVDPWGTIVAQASAGEAVVLARLDPAVLARVRGSLPALAHRAVGPDTPVDLASALDA